MSANTFRFDQQTAQAPELILTENKLKQAGKVEKKTLSAEPRGRAWCSPYCMQCLVTLAVVGMPWLPHSTLLCPTMSYHALCLQRIPSDGADVGS